MTSPNSLRYINNTIYVIACEMWFVYQFDSKRIIFFFLKWENCCNFHTIFQHLIDFVSKKENKINSLCTYFVGLFVCISKFSPMPLFLVYGLLSPRTYPFFWPLSILGRLAGCHRRGKCDIVKGKSEILFLKQTP